MNAGLVVLLAIMGSVFAAPETQKANAVECMACKMMVSYAETLAEDEEPEIEAAIDHAGCDHLGLLAKTCRELVHQYLPEVITRVKAGQPPNVVCGPHELHMCASEKKTVVKRAVKQPGTEKANQLECMACKMMVSYVENLAEEEEPAIEGAIDHVGCDHLGPLAKTCRELVHQYLPEIITRVEAGQPPERVCGPRELHMCASEKKTVVKREVKKPVEKIPGMCDICAMLVKYCEDYAEEDEPSIEHAIDTGICQAFGSGAFDQACEAAVHMFLPMVITAMKKNPNFTPHEICVDVGMC